MHVLPVLPELHYPRLEDTSLVMPLLPRPFSNHFLVLLTPQDAAGEMDKNAPEVMTMKAAIIHRPKLNTIFRFQADPLAKLSV